MSFITNWYNTQYKYRIVGTFLIHNQLLRITWSNLSLWSAPEWGHYYEFEPFTYGISWYLKVDNLIIELNYRAANWYLQRTGKWFSMENYTRIIRGEVLRAEIEVKPFSYSWPIGESNFVLDAIGYAVYSVTNQLAHTLPFNLSSLQIGLMHSVIRWEDRGSNWIINLFKRTTLI